MEHVRIKQKFQITIPSSLRNSLELKEGDLLAVRELDGQLVLIPQETKPKNQNLAAENTPPAISYLGSGRGLFASEKDVENFIKAERAKWES